MRYEVYLKSVAQPKPQIQRLKTQKPLDPKKLETQRTQDLKDHKLAIRGSKCKTKIGSEKTMIFQRSRTPMTYKKTETQKPYDLRGWDPKNARPEF